MLNSIVNYSQFELSISVYDDCSDESESNFTLCKRLGVDYFRSGTNYGKKKYYQLINKAFASIPDADYYFMLPDDFSIEPNYFKRCIEIFKGITNYDKVCLNTDIDGRLGKECWTGYKAIDMGNVYRSQWVDMCFLANRKFFDSLGKIEVGNRWDKDESLGSGVGAFISRRLHQQGLGLYHAKEHLTTHKGIESKMNPR
ncbi:MAG: hypothetical protein WCJ33_02140 [Pseudomonadota bacterium]